ncbi:MULTISPECIES: hypothetical protein [Streptomyces]|uniref:hypothetical protein n=1 Tax=Streptomyces TaxID=1883 RepID=UPI000AEFB0C3|nr:MULTISPECIES: hypothetical protein [Streptomyces]MDH6227677.1 hypothetical protein [Streptomyces sp. MJP52]
MDNATNRRPRRRVLGRAAAAVAGCAALLGLQATPAPAAGTQLAAPYQNMDTCPTASPLLTAADNLQVGCVHSEVGGGTFRIGDYSVPIGAPMKLNWGIRWSSAAPTVDVLGSTANVYDTANPVGGPLLDAPVTEAPLPGLANFWPGVTSADIKVEPAGPIRNFVPLAVGSDHPLFEMPIKLKVIHPLLGSHCYLGTDAKPIVLRASSPAAPDMAVEVDPNGHETVVIKITDGTLSDSSVAIPGASRCGLLGLGESNWIVNSLFDLPAGPGGNAVTFTGVDTSIAIDGSLESLTAALNDARG